ncbi:hypothetical protein AVEN_31193-1 [Araneus ventricosus]|uniref:Uncharacterized protein n=1 Tax=Araneus ventricosus TaxID=182803 RepID=A0A4Y2KIQ7_ARAVE|nr:hypothetical protein AVEN_31193-1 [Araneus ventricosus]
MFTENKGLQISDPFSRRSVYDGLANLMLRRLWRVCNPNVAGFSFILSGRKGNCLAEAGDKSSLWGDVGERECAWGQTGEIRWEGALQKQKIVWVGEECGASLAGGGSMIEAARFAWTVNNNSAYLSTEWVGKINRWLVQWNGAVLF